MNNYAYLSYTYLHRKALLYVIRKHIKDIGIIIQEEMRQHRVKTLDVLKKDVYVPINCKYDGDSIVPEFSVMTDTYSDCLLSMPLKDKLALLYEILRMKCTKDGITFKYINHDRSKVDFVASLAALSGYSTFFFGETNSPEVNLGGTFTQGKLLKGEYAFLYKADKYHLDVLSGMIIFRRHGKVYRRLIVLKDSDYGYNAILAVAVLEEVYILDNKPIAYVIRGVGRGFNCLKGYVDESNLGELVHVADGETVVLGRMDMCMFLKLSGTDGRIKTASGKVVFLIPKRTGIMVGVPIESCDYVVKAGTEEVNNYIKSQEAAAVLVLARETGMYLTSIL